MTMKSVNNTGMAITIDTGQKKEIHPDNKQTVAHRLALLAKGLVYKKDVVYSGPIYDQINIKGNKAIISFKHVGSGLICQGKKLKGFEIAGKDYPNLHFPAQAKIIGKNKVQVWHNKIDELASVRYAWGSFPEVSLFNREGLPASPFRTNF